MANRLELLALLTISILAMPAQAQVAQASGRLLDPTGSIVPAAMVTAKNVDTGVVRQVDSNDEGYFTIPSLTPGNYEIRVQKDGFKSSVRTGLRLLADEKVRLDFVLELGTLAETVSVTSDVPLLSIETSELSKSMTAREYNQLPLIQIGRMRQPANFLFLTPGVHGNLDLNGNENVSATNQIQVHGSQKQNTEVLVDGLSGGQSRTIGSMNEMSPPVDAVMEFKIQSSQVAAEYGHSGSAVVNFTIKSGTNDLHGSAFEYFRNDKLDARNWLAPSRALTRQNEFGVTVGGPIWLPKLYNGRDRSFFFLAWSASRKRGLDNVERVRIPDANFLRGNFAGLMDARGAQVPIYDPATTRPNASGGSTRDPFPSNVIPGGRLDPVAVNAAKLFPGTNANAAGGLNYQDWIGESQLDPDVLTAKLDHIFSTKHKVFGTFNWNQIPRLRNRSPLPNPINDGFIQAITSRVFRFSYDAMLTPALLHNLSVGYNRFRNPAGSSTFGGGWPEKLGLQSVPNDMFPTISFTNGYATLGASGYSDNIDQTYFVRDTLSWNRGAHAMKFGTEIRFNQWNDKSVGSASMAFNALGTGLPGVAASGDGFASFMLGDVHSGAVSNPSTTGTRTSYWSFFAQDDFKVTSTLTLNLGFRFEFERAPYEANDRQSIVDLKVPNPGAGNLPGALIFAGEGQGRTGRTRLAQANYNGLGPRFGFAWRPLSKTVFRGGYGLYYSGNQLGLSTAGFNIASNFQTTDNGVTPAFRMRTGYPQITSAREQIDPTFLNNQNATYLEANATAMPRTQNWSFGFQREMAKDTVLEATYLANHSTGQVEPQIVNINQLHPDRLALGSLLTSSVTSAAAVAAGIRVPYPGFTGSVAQALRAYPQYRTLTSSNSKDGKSIYHAMQTRFVRRFSSGFSMDATYTLSKNIGYNNPSFAGRGGADNILQDNFNRGLERSILPYDIPHALLVHYTYDLPFRASGWKSKVVGGWSLSGVHRYQSGNPLPILQLNALPIFNRALRPDRVSGADPSTGISIGAFEPNVDRMINPGAFTPAGANRLGNSAPYIQDLRNFRVFSEDFTLMKKTPVNERVSTEFVAQFINAFNRHRFGEVDGNITNASFGRIRSASFPRFIQLALRLRF